MNPFPTLLLFSALLAAEPNVRALLSQAETAFTAGQCDKARELADQAVKLAGDDAGVFNARGSLRFRCADISGSIEDFDRAIALDPEQEPHHWQRGISYYYAGEYEKGAKQFEIHRTVNPHDVENAAWHFLCVARWKGLEEARKQLIPIQGDPRIPMAEIHKLFAGRATPQDVLDAANAGNPSPNQLRNQLCYAHLYLGLYYEAIGKPEESRQHIKQAADDYAMPHYMGRVAQVHSKLRK